MLRGVIFDLDGTLGDTLPVCYRAFAKVFRRRLGREFSSAEIHAMFGPSEEGILRRLCPDDADGALKAYLAAYRRAHARCPEPFAGIRGCLDMLRRRGVERAIVTGKGPRSAAISLGEFELSDLFPQVEAGSPDGGVKPEAMGRILRRWGFGPRDVVGVGDSPSDIRSARAAGVASVAAAWAPGTSAARLAACNPDWLFRDVPAFREWLEAGPQLRR